MQLTNALSIEGYLDKQSGSMLKIFQKRYLVIRSKGQFLLWFKKKPQSIDQNPKGIMKIENIISIQASEFDEELFMIKYDQRQFIFRCENQETRNRWVSSLEIIKLHLIKASKNRKKSMHVDNSSKSPEKNESWKWKKVDNELSQKIRIENEKVLISEGDDNIIDKSIAFLSMFFENKNYFDLERNIVHGFNRKKGYLSDEKKWYFVSSEFNLFDENDQNPNQRVKPILEKITKKQHQNKQEKDESSEEEASDSQQKMQFKVNTLYEFDAQQKKMTGAFDLVNFLSWEENTSVQPFELNIKYIIPKNFGKEIDIDYEEEEKQFTLKNDYLTEIQKWSKAFKIIFEKCALKGVRAENQERRYEQFQIKLWKINDEAEWRVLGTNEKPDKVYLNLSSFKLAGFTYQLVNVNIESLDSKKEQYKTEVEGKEVIVDLNCLLIIFKDKTKVTLSFSDSTIEKNFKKKLKKLVKKIESLSKSKSNEIVVEEKSQATSNTYHIDKKIRETSNSIKINFYEIMDREVVPKATNNKTQDQTFFEKIANMFCGQPPENDFL